MYFFCFHFPLGKISTNKPKLKECNDKGSDAIATVSERHNEEKNG